jgi:tRNA threonylcarbamoyladenosine modification (KEOPS) complex Cgi121 subunit
LTDNPGEFNKKISIIGFSNVKLENTNSFLEKFRKENKGAPIQFFNAKHVAGPLHLYFAALNALNAFEKKTNISNNLEVETLLYASAQRQIQKAIKTVGIKQDSTEIATLIITEDRHKKIGYLRLVSENVPGERNDKVLELTNKKIDKIKKLFNISDTEFETKLKKKGGEKETLTDLVIERMALLVTKS